MTLQELRTKIDAIDSEVVRLLNERAALAEQVGNLKKKSGSSVFAPEREEELLRKLERMNGAHLPNRALRAIYCEILSASRSKQKPLEVTFLGPEGTYSHQAALQRFGTSDHFRPGRTIPELFAAVSRGESDLAVVPIENSTEGSVTATHDCLVETDLVICGEIYLRINHVLCAKDPNTPIKRILSHPQALAQCRNWINQHYPNAEQISVSSTSQAAIQAAEDPHAAAISSAFAAKLYQLKVLHSHIQDITTNLTRFLILSRDPASPGRHDKTSLLFAIAHKVGALSDVLGIFAAHKLNLQKIESRPSTKKPWEYLFFVDVSGNYNSPTFRAALKKIYQKTLWLKVLGAYPQSDSNA